MKNWLILVFIFTLALFLIYVSVPDKPQLNKSSSIHPPINKTGVWLNIFIHGTVKPPLKLGDVSKISKDEIDNTFYDFSASHLRQDPRFYQYQPMQRMGMQPVLIDKKPGNASAALAEIYKIQYSIQYPGEINLFYTWGWSGLLSRSKRLEEAKNFQTDLRQLIAWYKRFGITPHVRVVAYSHGANVVLNLAAYQDSEGLEIDESVFIGMPVHRETDCFVNSPIFKKIYQVYSTADRAQRLDLISTEYFASHQKFHSRKGFKVPEDKIVHLRLSTTSTIEDPVCKMITGSYKVDPRHIELWSFGWKPKSYRQKFPLAPLSAASVLPYIIYKTEDLGNDLWVEVNPYQENMRVTSWVKNKRKDIWIMPFISKYEFEILSEVALQYEPSEHKLEHYEDILRDALIYAIKRKKSIFYTCLRKRTKKGSNNDTKSNGSFPIKPISTGITGATGLILTP